jgi:uncharacterized membrane protein YkvI
MSHPAHVKPEQREMEWIVNSVEQSSQQSTKSLGRMLSIAVVGLMSCLMAIDALTHSQPLVLPLISAALTVVGFTWSAFITLRRSEQETPLPDRLIWPALILFFGFAAAMLSDADQLVTHFQIH